MKTTDTTNLRVAFSGWALLVRFFVMVLAMCAVFSAGVVQAHADTIGSITRDGDTRTYSSLDRLAYELQFYEGRTFVVDMLDNWDASVGGEDAFDHRLVFPKDCTATFNMHGYLFNRGNVNEDDADRYGELIYVSPGATLTINGSFNREEIRRRDGVHVFTDVEQKTSDDYTITVDGACLAGGYSRAGAGCIVIDGASEVTINDVTMAGCKAYSSDWFFTEYSGYGGAISIMGGLHDAQHE